MLCPRECGANRQKGAGACRADDKLRVAKTMLHMYEEPPISGTRGSGAIFFGGCNLQCGYCQNAVISQKTCGEIYSVKELADEMLELQFKGAHNINLVTGAHYVPHIADALALIKPQLKIPVVYNSSGYEKPETLKMLNGLIDIYLPDFKYVSRDAAQKYSHAPDYPEVAVAAISEMVRQTGGYVERDGLALRGTIIRHLVLPNLSHDGEEIMRIIANKFDGVRVSVMSQYTPDFNSPDFPELNRRITLMEYNRVLQAARRYGLDGFMQYKDSASGVYTPNFDE